MRYSSHFSTKTTPQSQPIPGKEKQMTQNNAVGFSFILDDWKRLDRFLILGSEGNTYYTTEKKLTVENAQCVLRCLQQDGKRAVARIVEISKAGRAPKNDPAIFALAMAASVKEAAPYALAALPEVCRIGTHLFRFCEAVEKFRGHGRALNTALKNWYLGKDAKSLAYQVTKYQQREGWSHRDVLRLCRPKVEKDSNYDAIFSWIVGGKRLDDGLPKYPGLYGVDGCADMGVNSPLAPIWAFEKAKKSTDKNEIVRLILDYQLPRECIPTQFLNEVEVWEALLEKMPMEAMVRNLGKMTSIGLIKPMSKAAGKVIMELTNQEKLKKSRLHPIKVLAALKTYAQGHGEKGKLSWSPVSQVIDALDGAFYNTFQNVEPTGKRWLLGIDVSGSMWSGSVAGVPDLTPGMAAGAMALVTAAVEPSWYMAAFNTRLQPFAPSPRQRLDDFCARIARLPWGGTDCAQPMLHALQEKLDIDVFVIYTDSETWHGAIHPSQALQQYRNKTGINSKLIVNGMVSNGFSIADPSDSGMLDCVGFATDTPAVMADFVRE